MNKKVGKGLASAIEKGEEATGATKETIGMQSWSIFCDLSFLNVDLQILRQRKPVRVRPQLNTKRTRYV